jgi:prepilin-type processing-associated H-X9-DG protein/prepilin-type N-terminal cleavage/methylation domain-containing protein
MFVQDLKRWHWVLIGIIAGIVVGQAQSLVSADRPVGGRDFITQPAFESKLRYSPVLGKPYLANIILHASGTTDLVSVSELNTETLQYRDRWFAAPRPYVSLQLGVHAAARSDYTVKDYLTEAAATNPAIKFSTAWWESTWGAIAVWGAGGALLIGGVWPFVLNLLVGAGLGRRPKEANYDLSGFKGEASEKVKGEVTDEDRQRLEALEADMAAALAASGESHAAAGSPAQPTVIRELVVESVEQSPATAEIDKDFAGEFYPVEKKSPHGFTLVEILVVVGILAALIAILLPILSHARARSQQVKCASNLGQIGAGLELYNQNFKHLPQVATPAALADALKAISIEGVMMCPADQSGSFSYSLNSTYAGMPKSAGDATEILASESVKRHDGRSNIVFFDGHVDEK